MRRLFLSTAVLLALVAGSTFIGPSTPGGLGKVYTIHAQTLPITRTVTWDPNPVGDAVTNYVVRLDGVIVGSPTGVTQPITITTAGSHTVSVVAVNAWAESAPATLTFNVVVPGQPANLRFQ